MIFMNRKIDVAVGFLSAVVLGTAGLGGESVALCPEKVTKPVMQENSTSGNYDYAISLTLSDEGAQKFAAATERL